MENGMIKFSGKITDVLDNYLGTPELQTNIYHPQNNIVKEVSAMQNCDKIELTLKYEGEVTIMTPFLHFTVFDNYGNPIFGSNPFKNGLHEFGNPKKKGEIKVEISSPYLANGTYPVSVWLFDGPPHLGSSELFFGHNCIGLNVENMNEMVTYDDTDDGLINPKLTYNYIYYD